MDRDLLDAVGAAVIVVRPDAGGDLVIDAASAIFRDLIGLSDPAPEARAAGVLPAAWLPTIEAARRQGSAPLPPACLPGRPGTMVAGTARRVAGEPVRIVVTLAPAADTHASADAEALDILDRQGEMVCRWRPDGTVYYCNAAYARQCGREKAAVVGANLADLTPSDELHQILANVSRLGPSLPEAAYDHRITLPDGAERWQEWIDHALFGPDGRTVVGYQSTGRDITARKEAERALHLSEQRLGLALAAADQAFWEMDAPSGAIRIDGRGDYLFGYGADDPPPGLARWTSNLHPDDRDRVMAELERHMRGESERFVTEYRFRRKDGNYRWFLDHAVAVERDGDGRARHIVGTSADVDVRHHFEDQLEASEQRLRLALEAAGLSIWEADFRACLVRIDATGAARAGRGPAPLELPFARLRELLPDKDARAALRRYREHALGRTGRFQGEYRVRRADGSSYWVEVYGLVTERDADGRALRMVGVSADVTGRKEAELRLAHLAMQDHLTGLPNRRALDEALDQAIARARRGEERLGVVLLDLDGFKRVNDGLGHLAGDRVLAVSARRLRLCVRRGDTVARFGGDEFAVLAVGLRQRRRLERLAARIIDRLGAPVPLADGDDDGGGTARVGVSVGLAIFPDDGATAVDLLRRADAALYAAKRAHAGFRFAADLDDAGRESLMSPPLS